MLYKNCTPHVVRVYTPSQVVKETTWKGRDGLANKIVQEFDPEERAWRLPREFAIPYVPQSVVKYTLKSGMLPKWELPGTNTQLRVEYQDRFAGGDPDDGITERHVIAVDMMFFSAFDSGMKFIVSFQYLQAVKEMSARATMRLRHWVEDRIDWTLMPDAIRREWVCDNPQTPMEVIKWVETRIDWPLLPDCILREWEAFKAEVVAPGLLDRKYQQSLVTTGPAVFSAGKQVGCLNLVVEG